MGVSESKIYSLEAKIQESQMLNRNIQEELQAKKSRANTLEANFLAKIAKSKRDQASPKNS